MPAHRGRQRLPWAPSRWAPSRCAPPWLLTNEAIGGGARRRGHERNASLRRWIPLSSLRESEHVRRTRANAKDQSVANRRAPNLASILKFWLCFLRGERDRRYRKKERKKERAHPRTHLDPSARGGSELGRSRSRDPVIDELARGRRVCMPRPASRHPTSPHPTSHPSEQARGRRVGRVPPAALS